MSVLPGLTGSGYKYAYSTAYSGIQPTSYVVYKLKATVPVIYESETPSDPNSAILTAFQDAYIELVYDTNNGNLYAIGFPDVDIVYSGIDPMPNDVKNALRTIVSFTPVSIYLDSIDYANFTIISGTNISMRFQIAQGATYNDLVWNQLTFQYGGNQYYAQIQWYGDITRDIKLYPGGSDASSTSVSAYIGQGGTESTGGSGGNGSSYCLAKGTLLLTPSGYVPVESLHVGDKIVCGDKRVVAVKSIFSSFYNKTTVQSAPYTIEANAFGKQCPPNALIVSGRHAIQIAEGLWEMPDEAAKNNKLVKQAPIGSPVTYYHVALPDYAKDTLVANGQIVESLNDKQYKESYLWNSKLNGYERKLTKCVNHSISK